jgi:hypothetical protein
MRRNWNPFAELDICPSVTLSYATEWRAVYAPESGIVKEMYSNFNERSLALLFSTPLSPVPGRVNSSLFSNPLLEKWCAAARRRGRCNLRPKNARSRQSFVNESESLTRIMCFECESQVLVADRSLSLRSGWK